MDDHGNLSPEEEESQRLLELLEELERIAPEQARQSALARGLPALAFDLLVKRADSDDPIEREESRAILIEHGLELAIPGVEPEVPGDQPPD